MMRNVFILFIVLAVITACCKDEFNPLKPKNGQKAELFLDHYVDVKDERVLLWRQKESSRMGLAGFGERELGYTYRVKAKVYVSEQLVMDDGVNSWFEFDRLISKEKYTNEDSFEISLVNPIGFYSGGDLAIKKEGDQFSYGDYGYSLRFVNEEDKVKIDGILLRGGERVESAEDYLVFQEYMRKMDLKAVVTHDPNNYGKGYLVHALKFNE